MELATDARCKEIGIFGELGTTLDTRVVPSKNGVFWDVTPCSSCKNRRLGGT
jgi:hypothetical protein